MNLFSPDPDVSPTVFSRIPPENLFYGSNKFLSPYESKNPCSLSDTASSGFATASSEDDSSKDRSFETRSLFSATHSLFPLHNEKETEVAPPPPRPTSRNERDALNSIVSASPKGA
jgi:hypothetical protein